VMDRADSTTQQVFRHLADAGLMTGSPSVVIQ